MAIKTAAQLAAGLTTSFPDNTTGVVTPATLRSQQQDIIDSSGGGIDLNNSAEVKTGEFFGGRPVYAKSITGGIAPLAAGAVSAAISTGISLGLNANDLSWVDVANSFTHQSGGIYPTSMPLIIGDIPSNNADLAQCQLHYNGSSFTLTNRGSQQVPIWYNIVIKYVKGTDAVQ